MARPPLEPGVSEGALVGRLRALGARDDLALVDAGGAASHRALWAAACEVAAGLGGPLGGEPVALLAPPGRAWVAAFFGVVLAGGVALPLSPLHPEDEVRYFVADSGARRALLDVAAYGDRAAWLAPARVAPVGAPAGDGPGGAGGPGRGPPGGARWPGRGPSDGDGALLLYTSGTTGRPKGALLTGGNVFAQASVLAEAWGMGPGDRLVHALPLHHLHGVVVALATTLLAGGAARMLPRFEAVAAWDALADGTAFMGVPTMYHRLLEAYDGADGATRARWAAAARALRLATSGSAALPVSLAARWAQVAGRPPLERYGMTEIGMATSNPLDGERRPGTVGRPLPGVELRRVADGGAEAAPGEPGELWARGPGVFAGYWGRDEATRAAFTDGWFRTGDVAELDEAGYVRLLGRASVDILKSAGYKLSAVEIEEALRAHPAVADVAVVGLPDEALGDRVVACVVAAPGAAGGGLADELAAQCRARLAPYKVPRAFVVVADLPRNALGKVQKPELVRRLLAAVRRP
jgi:malonyl-CoA/methylmalonyl-CoA synthetase